MANLITYSDFAAIRDVSSNINSTKRIDPYILESQEMDIRPLLGDIFFQEVINNQSTYTTLLSGGTYTYEGYTYSFQGLKKVHVYYAYARLLLNDDIKSTPSGFKNKITQESEPISETTRNRMANQNREAADTYWKQCYDFLCRQDSSIYDNWCGKKQGNSQSKITAI